MTPRRPILPLTEAEIALFWSKVDKGDGTGCWLWTGETTADGYGVFRRSGGRKAYAHRVGWCLHHGLEVPAHLDVLHHCDTPACVRGTHFFTGTQADNNRDRAEKGRTRMGRGNARITAEVAASIRARYAAGGITQGALAAEHGLSNQAVSMIVTGQTWATQGPASRETSGGAA